jgi:transcriptional regulator with XRE-family HTH domain
MLQGRSMTASPTGSRRHLAAELRRLRGLAGKTLDDAAGLAGISRSALSRIENAQSAPSAPVVRCLLEVYGVDRETTETLIQDAKEARKKGWWSEYGKSYRPHFAAYLGFEQEASTLYSYGINIVPGLLQIEDYARAIIGEYLPNETLNDTDRRIQLRLSRQAVLRRNDAPEAWFVLDEALLRRMVGGPEIMARQLAHIRDVIVDREAKVQVLPFESGANGAMDTPFVLFGFPRGSQVLYIETAASAHYYDDEATVRHFLDTFNGLRASAVSFRDSLSMIDRIHKEYAECI